MIAPFEGEPMILEGMANDHVVWAVPDEAGGILFRTGTGFWHLRSGTSVPDPLPISRGRAQDPKLRAGGLYITRPSTGEVLRVDLTDLTESTIYRDLDKSAQGIGSMSAWDTDGRLLVTAFSQRESQRCDDSSGWYHKYFVNIWFEVTTLGSASGSSAVNQVTRFEPTHHRTCELEPISWLAVAGDRVFWTSGNGLFVYNLQADQQDQILRLTPGATAEVSDDGTVAIWDSERLRLSAPDGTEVLNHGHSVEVRNYLSPMRGASIYTTAIDLDPSATLQP
jgi:hypothetical protein